MMKCLLGQGNLILNWETINNDYNQTTQQANNTNNKRWFTARDLVANKPKINREMLLKTQFNLGFLNPDYETSSKAYDLPQARSNPLKILEKGNGKDTKQHFIYGNNKTVYKTTNLDSYKDIDQKSNNDNIIHK